MAELQPPATPPPPGAGPADQTLLFDGVCNLCNASVRFVIRRDPQARFKLASLQSDAGRAILSWAGLDEEDFDTMVFVDLGRIYTRSDAILNVIRYFPRRWSWLAAARIVPRPLRDWAYNRIARNRYSLFGRRDTCMVPTPELRKRFL